MRLNHIKKLIETFKLKDTNFMILSKNVLNNTFFFPESRIIFITAKISSPYTKTIQNEIQETLCQVTPIQTIMKLSLLFDIEKKKKKIN